MGKRLRKSLIALCSMTLALTASALIACKPSNGDKGNSSSSSVTESSVTESGSTSEETSEGAGETCAHTYGTPVVVEPTCTTKGSSTVTCSLCGDVQVTVLDATGHEYALSKEVAASCTIQGYNEYTCECGVSYTEITADKKGHDTLDAVWTIVGEEWAHDCVYVQIEEATCVDCGEAVAHEEEIVKHEYLVKITTTATCSQDGVKTYICKCGDSYEEAFKNEGGHAWVAGAVDTTTGITSWTCSHNASHTKTSFSAKDMIEATIPAEAIKDAKEIELQNATLELPQEVKNQLNGEVKLSVDTLDYEAKDEATANLSEEEKEKLANTPIFNFNMTKGEDAVTKFDKEITVTVPYNLEDGADPADIAVWYIDDAGKLTSIKATYSEVDGQGYATFTTDHFSYYTVVRLSAKERCALYGCEERVTVVAPTCEADGYTLTKCIRCNTTTRSAFVKALGHDYKTNTVAPTCTAKGYTTHTCTRTDCGYSYATNWTEMVAHQYEATVVAPTCTAKGYTVHTCTACNSTYVDTYVNAKGHSYVEGSCTVCGKEDPSYVEVEDINFYFNAIEALLNANTYYLEAYGLKVDVTNLRYSVKGGNVKEEMDYTLANIEGLQLEFGFDDNGYLVGKGYVFAEVDEFYNNEAVSGVMEAQVVLYNGYVYMWLYADADNLENQSVNLVVSQDSLLEQMGMTMDMLQSSLQSVGELEDVVAVIEGVKNTPNSPLNKLITDIMEYVYIKTETATGYHFELNFDRVEEVYEILTKKTVSETVDLVLGEGAYNQICTYLTATVDKQVSVVVEDLTTALDLYGIDIENVYNLINLSMGGEDDIRDMVAQCSTMKVSELLDAMMEVEEAGSVDYKAMITEYSTQLKDMPMMELIAMLSGSMGGDSGTVEPDYDYEEDYKEEIVVPKKRAEEALPVEDPTYEMVMKVVSALKKSSFSFDTDKTGELLNYTAKLVNFGDIYTLEELRDQMEEAANNYDENGWYEMDYSHISINGTIVFKPNGSYIGSYDNLIQTGNNMQKVADGYFELVKSGKLEPNDSERVFVDVEDGEVYTYIGIYNVYDESEEMYAGQKAIKKEVYGNVEKVVTPYPMIQKLSNCLEWAEYTVSAIDYYCDFTVWVNEAGEYIGIELSDYATSDGFITAAGFYYNSKTGEYAVGWRNNGMHNYILIEHKPAEGCEGRGYYKYSCTLCGEVVTNYYTNGHKTMEGVFELAEGAKSCEEGVYRVYTCTVCGEIQDKWYYGNGHYTTTSRKVIGETDCGSLVMVYSACACGEVNEFDYMEGGCNFDHVKTDTLPDDPAYISKYGHYIYTYRCAVTACAYTYTVEVYYKAEGCDIYRYEITRIGVKDGSDKVDYELTSKYHYDTQHLGYKDDSYVDEATGTHYVHTYCTACGEEWGHYEARYNEYDDMVYYYDYQYDYGWTRVFINRCEYEQYSLNGEYEGYGDIHEWSGWWRYSDSCTQYQLEGKYMCCYRCGEEEIYDAWYYPPRDHDYYYDYDLETYVCYNCGMKNETGADDNFVIEDLTYTTEDGTYTIGYYNKAYVEYSVYVVVNYGTANERYLDIVSCVDRVTYENSGIVTVNMEELLLALNNLDVNVETVSVVMQYWDAQSGEYDETTGEWEGSYIDCVVTFEDEKMDEGKDER